MDKMENYIALADLKEDIHENHNLKTIAWVIGIVIILAIIVFWFRKSHDHHGHESRYDQDFRCQNGQHKGLVKMLEKQVEKLEDKAYFTHGQVTDLLGFKQFANYELARLNTRCFPSNYIGFEERFERGGRCGDRHRESNCNKKFVRRDTYTPNTQEVVVTEDCNC